MIEPIANHLADTFGRENVFYDSWSIQPGDDILDKMNEGLEKADIFFFFKNSDKVQAQKSIKEIGASLMHVLRNGRLIALILISNPFR